MNALSAKRVSTLACAALVAASGAWATSDSLVASQKTLLENLREMDFSNPGVSFHGTLKGSFSSSVLDKVQGNPQHTEIGAATEGDFSIMARPTKDSRALVKFRAHQDWQKSHEEGINPVLFHWFSYEGTTLDQRLKFQLGDMRVHYSPLTVETPRLEPLQEAAILKAKRQDAMSYRNLDGSSARLLQGVNADYHAGNQFGLDDIAVQATVSRLRNQAKKPDQVFYDFDESDRYMLGGQASLSAFGFQLGGAYVYSLDRERSAENFFTLLMGSDTITLENNSVASLSAGADLGKILSTQSLALRLDAELALSNYSAKHIYSVKEYKNQVTIDSNVVGIGDEDGYLAHYVVSRPAIFNTIGKAKLPELDGQALLVKAEGLYSVAGLEMAGALHYLMNDENFQSDLAQSPSYAYGTTVLNSQAIGAGNGAIAKIAAGTMEKLYFTKYETNPLQKYNLVSTDGQVLMADQFLYNNFKKAHFIRNGYTNQTFVRSEMLKLSQELDPALNLALPFGLATPDRSGVTADIDLLALNRALEVNVRFNSLSAENASFMSMGFGAAFRLGQFLGFKQAIDLNGAFENAKESDGLQRSSTRIAAGTKVGVIGKLSVHGSFQSIEKDYGPLMLSMLSQGLINGSMKGTETLILVGPEYELTTGSTLNFQYGILSNELDVAGTKASLDRNLIAADVRVQF